MGHFGETVAILLDTYGKCMSLVRKLGRHERSRSQEGIQSARQLRRQLRSDRSQVDSVYSAQLSHCGTAFSVGDSKSRLSLRKLARKLEATIKKIIQNLKDDPLSHLDYASLQSLSMSSRKQAMRTMSSLSGRVNKGQQRSERNGNQGSNNSRTSERKLKKKKSGASREALSQASRETNAKKGFRVSSSVATMSSDSTKLGEIRRRRQGASQNNAHVSYPIHSLEKRHGADVKGRGWWNPFRRRR